MDVLTTPYVWSQKIWFSASFIALGYKRLTEPAEQRWTAEGCENVSSPNPSVGME